MRSKVIAAGLLILGRLFHVLLEARWRTDFVPRSGGASKNALNLRPRRGPQVQTCASRHLPGRTTFLPTGISETFIRAFSTPYAVPAFFFAQTCPQPPNLTDTPSCRLDGNADHDRMSAGADGAGWGVSAATSFTGPKARWCQLGRSAERPERRKRVTPGW
jgi:hypothetical protein